MKRMAGSLLMFAVCLALGSFPAVADVTVHDAWVAETPPGAMATGAFMVIQNDGDRIRKLVAATSPVGERLELHRSLIENGIARMIPQSEIVIPPGEKRILEPGGYHVMVVRPGPLEVGDRVEITLRFGNGEERVTHAEVRRHGDSHHSHH